MSSFDCSQIIGTNKPDSLELLNRLIIQKRSSIKLKEYKTMVFVVHLRYYHITMYKTQNK